MRRWVVFALLYVACNFSGICFAALAASRGALSPPDALDVVEFFTWLGPIVLAIGLLITLRVDKAEWYEWPIAVVFLAGTAYCNFAFLHHVYGNI
jgi:hypothetical protein